MMATNQQTSFSASVSFCPEKQVCSAGRVSRIPYPSPVSSPSAFMPGSFPSIPYVSGLDKLYVSCWLAGEGFNDLRRKLQDRKDEFDDEHICGPETRELPFDIGWEGMSFNMSRTGAKAYPYKLQTGDIVLLFSNHQANAPQPNCRIEIHSMSCWNPGFQVVMDRFFELLEHLGCKVMRNVVTEQDITADLMGVDFANTGFADVGRWLVRDSSIISPKYEHFKPVYIAFGKGDFMMKAYNKTNEFKNNPVKKEFFNNVWYDRVGYSPEHVTRIEVQIRRNILKTIGINTYEDLLEGLDSIWKYCVGTLEGEPGWARFAVRSISERERKNKHQARYITDFLWQSVRSISFGNPHAVPAQRCKLPPQVNIDHLEKVASGCFLSVCGVKGMHPDDLDGHISYCMNRIYSLFMDRYKFNRKVYVNKIETVRNAAINTFFADMYPDSPDSHDCFVRDSEKCSRNFRRIKREVDDSKYVWKTYGSNVS